VADRGCACGRTRVHLHYRQERGFVDPAFRGSMIRPQTRLSVPSGRDEHAHRLRTGVGDGARRGSGVAVATGFEAGRGVAVGRRGATAALGIVGVGDGTLTRCGAGGGTLAGATSTRGVFVCGTTLAPSPAAWAAPLSDAAASADWTDSTRATVSNA